MTKLSFCWLAVVGWLAGWLIRNKSASDHAVQNDPRCAKVAEGCVMQGTSCRGVLSAPMGPQLLCACWQDQAIEVSVAVSTLLSNLNWDCAEDCFWCVEVVDV